MALGKEIEIKIKRAAREVAAWIRHLVLLLVTVAEERVGDPDQTSEEIVKPLWRVPRDEVANAAK